jgi:hypothetical protein|tara:strand:- start:93 stop:353 length:261 start_codon:yes stop_codon:yes gene_type:complete
MLPSSLEEMVRYHHEPLNGTNVVQECCITNVADIIIKAMELGSIGDTFVPPIEPKLWEQLSLNPKDLDVFFDRVDTQFNDFIDFSL